jgi:hypothetical protein
MGLVNGQPQSAARQQTPGIMGLSTDKSLVFSRDYIKVELGGLLALKSLRIG